MKPTPFPITASHSNETGKKVDRRPKNENTHQAAFKTPSRDSEEWNRYKILMGFDPDVSSPLGQEKKALEDKYGWPFRNLPK